MVRILGMMGVMAVAAAVASAQTTPVLFSTKGFTGAALNRKITVSAAPETVLQTDGTNVITGLALVLQPGNGVVVTNLWPGKYSVSIDGIAKGWTITVPSGWTNAAPANAAQLTTNLVTFRPALFTAGYAYTAGALTNGALSLRPSYDGWGWQLGNPPDVLFWMDPSGVLLATPTNATANAVVGSDYAGYLRYFNQIGVGNDGKLYADGAGLTNLAWSAIAPRARVLAWVMASAYTSLTVQYDGNNTATNAAVVWPDGSYGVWTATNINSTWLTPDGWTVTYTNAGMVVAQPTMLRDQAGNVTNSPALLLYP